MSLQDQIDALDPEVDPLVVTYLTYTSLEFDTVDEYVEDEELTIASTVYYDPDYYGEGTDLEALAETRGQARYDADATTIVERSVSGDWDDIELTYRRCLSIEGTDEFIEWGELPD